MRFECQSCNALLQRDHLRQVQPDGDYWCPMCDSDEGGLFRLRLHRPPNRVDGIFEGFETNREAP